MYIFGTIVKGETIEIERLPRTNYFFSHVVHPIRNVRYAIGRIILPWDCKGVLIAMTQSTDKFFGDLRLRETVMSHLKNTHKVRIVDFQQCDQARILYSFASVHKLNETIIGVFITDKYICICAFQKEVIGYLCLEQIYIREPEAWENIFVLIKTLTVEYLSEEVIIVEDCQPVSTVLRSLLHAARIKHNYFEFSRGARQSHLIRWIIDIFSDGKVENRMPLSQVDFNFSWKINGRIVNRIRCYEHYLPFSFSTQVDTYRCKSIDLYGTVPFTDQTKCLAAIPVPYSIDHQLVTVGVKVDINRIVTTHRVDGNEETINYTYDVVYYQNKARCFAQRYRQLGILIIALVLVGAVIWGLVWWKA